MKAETEPGTPNKIRNKGVGDDRISDEGQKACPGSSR